MRAWKAWSRHASQPMRSPGSPCALLTPPSVMAPRDESHAAVSGGRSPCSRPRYISSTKRRAPLASQSRTMASASAADGTIPVGLCGQLATTSFV
eukprot:4243734-Prymnesium_polylepis.1